ncbi:hypothetical protein FK216_06735 [Moraxellaceae bacterium AER2_44_116]|jgi:hypothetical protein|nr:hypothetical protein [Moraxellaceae bacterium]TQC98543.1 hypothetical protein FK216_06735 [Moraxellaceae bacterium AER2_44_116]
MRWFSLFLIAWLGFINMVWADDTPTDLKLVLDKQNIKIWSYQVPKSSLYGFKAVTTVKSSLAGLVGLITDTEHASRWLYRTSEIDVLQRSENNQAFTIRVVTDFPWPFTDREALVDVRIAQDPKTAKVRIDSSESPNAANYPVKECCLRMPMVQGYWSFKPLGNGMVEVTMSGHADPGGRIPATAVNFLIQEHPYNTLKGLRKIIGEPSYQKLQYVYIRELP